LNRQININFTKQKKKNLGIPLSIGIIGMKEEYGRVNKEKED
jgi:hypothetical protein